MPQAFTSKPEKKIKLSAEEVLSAIVQYLASLGIKVGSIEHRCEPGDGSTTIFLRGLSGDPSLWNNGSHIVVNFSEEFQSTKSRVGSGPFELEFRVVRPVGDGVTAAAELLYRLVATVNDNRSVTFAPA